jgi:hypothetical protein
MGQFDSSKEEWARQNRDRAEFLLIYCREILPDQKWHGWSQTNTWSERARRAAEYRQITAATRRILIDNDGVECVLDKYGGADHLLVVIDRAGQIAFKQRKGSIGAWPVGVREIISAD